MESGPTEEDKKAETGGYSPEEVAAAEDREQKIQENVA